MPDSPKKRLTRDDWIGRALEVIADLGMDGVSVEALARDLHATKGSFYWHFRDRAALIDAALEYWEHAATVLPIAELSAIADPRERLRALVALAFGDDRLLLDSALAASSADPRVAAVVARVTSLRLAFLEQAYADAGMDPASAHHAAHVAYATYLGQAPLQRTSSTGAVDQHRLAMLEAMLVPPAGC